MERTLIQQGGGGCTIYLPKAWTTVKGLSAGAKVKISEHENGLFIEANTSLKKEITRELGAAEKQNIKYLLTHLYRRGYDRIVLQNLETKHIHEVQQITQSLLIGFEVTEQTATSCTVENLSEPTGEKYASIVSRAFLIIKESFALTKADLVTGVYANTASLAELASQQDRIVLFCKRLIAKGATRQDPVTHWELLSFLIHIEHAISYLHRAAAESKTKLSKADLSLIDETQAYFSLLADAYAKRNLEKANTVFTSRIKRYALCYARMEKAKGSEAIVLSHIRETMRLISLAGSSVLSICLEEALLANAPPSAQQDSGSGT